MPVRKLPPQPESTTRALAAAHSAVEGSTESVDECVQEAMSANITNGYFNTIPESPSTFPTRPAFRISDEQNDPIFIPRDTNALRKLLKKAEMQQQGLIHNQLNEDQITPGVFISGSDIASLIQDFSLNSNQSRAFRIICNHALGHRLLWESQLLMGVCENENFRYLIASLNLCGIAARAQWTRCHEKEGVAGMWERNFYHCSLSSCISSFGGDFSDGGCEIVGFVEVKSGPEKG
jgi:hypothetical protein